MEMILLFFLPDFSGDHFGDCRIRVKRRQNSVETVL